MFRNIFGILKIRRDERLLALVSTVLFTLLNALSVLKYYDNFSQLTDKYHALIVRGYHVSGFDPLTYVVMSDWDTAYNVYRHPLLAFFMYPLYLVNQVLMMLTGRNCALLLTALLLIACSVYSCLFLFRILRHAVGVSQRQTYLLCAFFFSFAYIMLSTMVPDHFIMSMTMLLLTLYVSSYLDKRFSVRKTIILFFFTAGISLNNGLKVFLAALSARGKKFFKPSYLLLAVVIPSAMMWGFAQWEHSIFVKPKEDAAAHRRAVENRKNRELLTAHLADSMRNAGIALTSHDDSLKLNAAVKKELKARAWAKYRHDHKQIWNVNKGKPIAKDGFAGWTDITTSRWDAITESLFGEGLLLHEDHLLGDVLRDRPLVVRYRTWANYLWEGLIVLMFIAGIWCGRRSRMLWTTMSFFIMDMLLHIGLGFGINEVYIMSAHYMFVVPIAVAFLFKVKHAGIRRVAATLLLLTTIYCWAWNLFLISGYMLR